MITVDYPSSEEELEIMRRGTTAGGGTPEAVLSAEQIIELQAAVKRIPIADHVYSYAEKLVRVTRPKDPAALDFCRKWLSWGAGPRASLSLVVAARARALLRGESCVSCADVAAVAPAVLRHRLGPNFAAQSDGVSPDDIVQRILAAIPQH